MMLDKTAFKQYVAIGFDKPVLYEPATWRRVKALMDAYMCPAKAAYPFNYGNGNGRYATDFTITEAV